MSASIMDEDRIPSVDLKTERLDASTFGLVYQEHRLSVYRHLRGRTRTDAEALDLAADTFERAFANLDRFRARALASHPRRIHRE